MTTTGSPARTGRERPLRRAESHRRAAEVAQAPLDLDTFDLNDVDASLRHAVADFARRELAPLAAARDRDSEFPAESVRALSRMGLFGLAIPERPGGGGLSGTRLQMSLVIEQVASADAATALTLMAHLHTTGLIARFGTGDQQERWLRTAASGEQLAAVCLTETDSGTDLAGMRSRASVTKEGGYEIRAHKTFITNGDHADFYVVFARLGDRICAFIVDAHTPGIQVGPPMHKLGLRASSTTEVSFDAVQVSKGDLLGAEGDGLRMAFESLDGARMSTSAQAVGIAQGALDTARRFLQQRVHAGSPVTRHQAVQLRIADMHIATVAARAMLYRASALVDLNGGTAATSAAATKVFCTDAAARVATQAVELMGGSGFMEEFEAARYLRDSMGPRIYDGTNDINRLLIARQLLRGA